MPGHTYRDLDVWQKSMDLVEEVYRISKAFPGDEQFGLTSQIRRSAISVPANIAEGQGRLHKAEFIRFLSVARGSLTETETHLLLAIRLGYVDRDEAKQTWLLAQDVGRLLNKLIRSLEGKVGTENIRISEASEPYSTDPDGTILTTDNTMKLVTFSHLHRTAPDRVEGRDTHVGIYLPGEMPRILNVEAAHNWLNKKRAGASAERPPATMLELLDGGPDAMERLQNLAQIVCEDEEGLWESSQPADDVHLLSPLPFPRTIRDFYAFEQHVKTARALRGLEMIPEWYDHPVFYYSNPGCVYGPGEDVPFPRASKEVDFELEIACIIGKPGRDISADDASDYVAGYLVMNDWSARDTWRNFESKLSMGPAKSKDFATSLGPVLVTPDELEDHREGTGAGTRYNLTMTARVNGKELSRGNANTLTHTFAQMVEWASTDVWLRPGDVLGSGTVGTGCILELRPENTGGWLKPGDTVEMEIEKLGVLRNTLVKTG